MNTSAVDNHHQNFSGNQNQQRRGKWCSLLPSKRRQPNLEDLCAEAKNARKMARCQTVRQMKEKMNNQRSLRNDLCPTTDETYHSHHGLNPKLREYFRPDIQSNITIVDKFRERIKSIFSPSSNQ